MLLAIDAGNTESGYCFIDADRSPKKFGKINNEELLELITWADEIVIERVASYGMAVGREVFETCEWIGRFTQEAVRNKIPVDYVYRREEKIQICGSPKAKDSNIRQALIDMCARHDYKNGKGTAKNPDFFYGFKADVWTAYAVGLTYLFREEKKDV